MSTKTLLTDLLKSATTVADSGGKSVLVTDGSGSLGKTANVASASKLNTKYLTNENLDDIKDSNFSSYCAGAGHSCLNTPNSDNNPFHLVSYRASGWYIHIFTTHLGVIYKRAYNSGNSTWRAWEKILTESDLTPILNRLTALENK